MQGRAPLSSLTPSRMQGAEPALPAHSCRTPLTPPYPPPPSGTIPACLSNLANLEYLQLQVNSLRGTIPESLCTIGPSLTDLYLAINKLTGA